MHQGASPLNPCSCGGPWGAAPNPTPAESLGAAPQTPLHIRAFGWGYMVIIYPPRGQPLEPLLLWRAWGIAPNPTPVESWGCTPNLPSYHSFWSTHGAFHTHYVANRGAIHPRLPSIWE